MAWLQSRVHRALVGAALATTLLLYATLYVRSGLSAQRTSGFGDDAVPFAAENADTLRYKSLLAQKDLEINSLRRMLDDIIKGGNESSVDSAPELVQTKNLTSACVSTNGNSRPDFAVHWDNAGGTGVKSMLNFSTLWLRPRMTAGRKRPQAMLILGVPHVRRANLSLLLNGLESLVNGISDENQEMVIIVVQVSEPLDLKYYLDVCRAIQTRFPVHFASGLIEIILPPKRYYPNMQTVPVKWGEAPSEARWRTKQCLDYIFLMAYSVGRCNYYVQLEDDIIAVPGYSKTLLDSAAKHKSNWLVMDFSTLGFAGKMLHSNTIVRLIHFIALFYEHKPVDVLLFNYVYVMECFSNVLMGESGVSETNCPELSRLLMKMQPALFRHVGVLSSHDDKARTLSDDEKDMGNKWLNKVPAVISHRNPPAAVTTSLKQYQEFSLVNCYNGSSVFWALNPQPDDYILFSFDKPTLVRRYRLLTGDERHPSDRAYDATVEVLPSSTSTSSTSGITPETSNNYSVISRFNESVLIDDTNFSLADGEVPANLGAILALRVSFHQASQSWILFKEVFIEVTG